MTDAFTLEQTFEPPRLDRAGKRAAIDAALAADPHRSDSDIARQVGCDHKTVGSRRKEIENSQRGNSNSQTSTERQHTLIAGAKDFDAKFPAETAEQAVVNAIAKGIVSLAPEAENKPDDHWKNDNPDVLFWDQPATVCYWNQLDQVVIKQQADWNEESDPYLRFAPENLPRLIARLQQIYDQHRAGGTS